ncbi:MAG: phosphotransferase [Actinomycetota bacterium]
MAEESMQPNPQGGDGAAEAAWAMLAENGLGQEPLARLLAETVADGAAEVAAVEPSVIGTGQVGENVRCTIRWAGTDGGQAAGVPGSVVIKLASSDPTSRAAAEVTRTYIREVGFYRDIAPSVDIRVPFAYHVTEDRPENRFVLVMEDISPAEVGNQLDGCDLARAELAVSAAADLHGSTWGRQAELDSYDWVDRSTPERAGERAGLFEMLFPGFLERYRDRLTDKEQAFGRWLASNFLAWQERRLKPQCLIHGDFRLDNMLFGTAEVAPAVTTVDWQTAALGHGLGDVAYFLSGALPPAELAASESTLLAGYRARLGEHGVDLSTDQMWEDYRLAAPAGYTMAVIASQLVGRTERGDDMFMVMAKGSADQALRVDTADLLG